MVVEREGKIVTRSEIKKGSGPMTPSWTTTTSSMSRFGRGEVATGDSRTVLATCFELGTATPGFIGLRIGVKVLSSRDLGYAPVKRNSAAQGPSVWTTSQ
jgi:hypothetical protein